MTRGAVRPLNVAIAAMGGQGGGVLADWLVSVAEAAGYLAQSTSVPGVAQRTGATIYDLEFGPAAETRDGREPVMALMPVPGDVDVVVAGELVEAARAVLRGIVTPDRTTVVTSSHRDYSLAEKMQMGDGRVDPQVMTERVGRAARGLVAVDMARIADETGSVISAVMLGAVAAAGIEPFSKRACAEAIERGGIGVARSLKGFEAGFEAASARTRADEGVTAETDTPPVADATVATLMAEEGAALSEAAHEFARLGVARTLDFQDRAYARLYLQRLTRIAAVDASGDLTGEVARYLALWMTFEDTIRVAELKTRRSRFERFRAEVLAEPGQIVRVTEFVHPRVEEICDTLPAPIGRTILDTPALRRGLGLACRRGRKIQTTSIPGFLLLYVVSGLKRWRRSTLRYRREQAEIETWLERIEKTAPADPALALELAGCQRLVKGYGDTHARGLASYRKILAYIDAHPRRADLASRVAALKEAALSDESGAALEKALSEVA